MNKFFLFAYIVLYIFKTVLYPLKTKGRENIPEGPAMVCANHSSYTDPIMISYAFGLPNILHFMAKIELFRIPLLGRYIKAMGSFGVDRGTNDMNAVRTAMKYIKSGEKVMIFPEGTRVLEEDAAAGKIGAVRIAMRLNVPIVPVYISTNRRVFSRKYINIGKPYYIDPSKKAEDSGELAAELMEKIYELKEPRT